MGFRSRAIRYAGRQMFDKKFTSASISRRGGGGAVSIFEAVNIASDIKTSLQKAGYLDNNLWEESYRAIIDSQANKAGNPGQETLLSEDQYFPGTATRYCVLYGEEFNPDEFISYVKSDLGDDYYYAINIIIDECASELYEAWDNAFGGDGIGKPMFRSDLNALNNYQTLAAARYGLNWNTVAGANARSAAAATRFLKQNSGGRPR